MTRFTAHAPAKVNLTLHVGPPGRNGRHPLRSLTMFAHSATDMVHYGDDGEPLSLTVNGPMAGQISGDNLVLEAARLLGAAIGRAVTGRFVLEKNLPVAAGIGGGSADAGAALRLLSAAWDVEDVEVLLEVAAGLGGDVPAALLSQSLMMEGEGERVTPLEGLATLHGVLANPGLACPTGPVFKTYDGLGPRTRLGDDWPPEGDAGGLIAWTRAGRNDLEAAAILLVPQVATVLDAIEATPGAQLSRMSGSGATCFGLYDSAQAAQAAAALLKAAHPDWWVVASELGDG